MPILVNVPAFGIVAFVTWLLLRGARESARANNIMVAIKLVALALFIGVGMTSLDSGQLHAVCPERFHGHPSGRGDRLFCLYRVRRDLDGGRRDPGPATQPAHRHLGGLAICTLIYVVVGFVLTGMVPYTELATG